MTLDEVVSGIPGFAGWTHTAHIVFFGWYLHTHAGLAEFGVSDIRRCYQEIVQQEPSNISQLLISLSQRKPAHILRRSNSYLLERRVRHEHDHRFGNRPITIKVHQALQALPARLSNEAQRRYLEEAIRCFRVESYRAAVVMTWNLAYDHVCHHILTHHLAAFNTQLQAQFSKRPKRPIVNRQDFTELLESETILVARQAQITLKNVHEILEEKLKRRNRAAHPSGVDFSQPQAEEFILDLVNNVVLKLS